MANIQIIGVPQSNYVWVVRMACEEKGVPCEHKAERPHSPAVRFRAARWRKRPSVARSMASDGR